MNVACWILCVLCSQNLQNQHPKNSGEGADAQVLVPPLLVDPNVYPVAVPDWINWDQCYLYID